jgi:Holliday junction resolvase RusA-like endonuclease
VRFVIAGKPAPGGSKRGFVRGGRVVMVDQSGQAGKDWRVAVQDKALAERGDKPLLTGPVYLSVRFGEPRPKAHYRKDGSLSTAGLDSPRPTRKPDALKLARALEDALTGIVFVDDSQIAVELIEKTWRKREDGYLTEVAVRELDARCHCGFVPKLQPSPSCAVHGVESMLRPVSP